MIDLDDADSLDSSLPEWIKQTRPTSGSGSPSQVPAGAQPAQPDDSTSEDRLSVGSRIAGAIKQPSYMPSRAGAPDAEPAPEVRTQFDPNLLPEAIRPRPTRPNEVPQPPVGVNSQRRLDLMGEESRLNKPTDPSAVDPQTGKPMYRMGWGQRVLGTVANFATGFSGRGGPAVYVGPGATNWRYDREENLRKGRLAGVESDLSEQEKLEGSQEQAYRDAISQAFKAQIGEKDIALGKAAEENAATRAELAKLKVDQGPTSKTADTAAERTQVADKMGLKGEERKSYILTGKLPNEGRQATELDTWMAAFRRDNGRNPTADEIANRKSRQSSRADQIEKDKDQNLARAEADAKGQLGKLDVSAYTRDASKLPGETPSQWRQRRQQEIYADLETKKTQIQKDYETRAAANAGGGRPSPSSLRTTSVPPKPTQAAPAGRVWVYDKKTGNRGTIPASQLKSATSGQDAKYGTW